VIYLEVFYAYVWEVKKSHKNHYSVKPVARFEPGAFRIQVYSLTTKLTCLAENRNLLIMVFLGLRILRVKLFHSYLNTTDTGRDALQHPALLK
jgi:hypothetical protein